MKNLIFIFILFFTATSYGNEVVSTLLSKTAQKAEEKAEAAVNDMFDNIEVSLSGFYKGKPSYEITTLLPLYEASGRNTFVQGHLSTQAEIEMFNIGLVQRHALYENKLIAGYNFFYDRDLDNSHERFGIGADLLSSLGDVHLNYYDAVTDFVVVNGRREYTLDGFDMQIAFPLPYLPTSKLYAEVFSWIGINSSRDLEGETYSIKSLFPYGMSLEFGKTSYDQISRDEGIVTLSVNLYKFKQNKNSISEELSKCIHLFPMI